MTNNDHYMKLENMMHSALVMQLTGGKVTITKGEAQITHPVSKGFVHSTGAMRDALWDHITDETQCFWPDLGQVC